jgi:hypothetical protein
MGVRGRLLVACTLAVACDAGVPKSKPPTPAPAPSPVVPTVPLPAAPVPAHVPSIDDTFRELDARRDPDHLCFAVSQNRRRVACAFDEYDSETMALQRIQILGDVGDAESTWTYVDIQSRFGSDGYAQLPPKDIDHAVLAAAHRALLERHYVSWQPDEAELLDGATARAGTWTVRRHVDGVELQCGTSWVPIELDTALEVSTAAPDRRIQMRVAVVTDDRILLALVGHVAGEGWHGDSRAAQLIEAKALCPNALAFGTPAGRR